MSTYVILHYQQGPSVEGIPRSRIAGYRSVRILPELPSEEKLVDLDNAALTDHIRTESPLVILKRAPVLADFELGGIKTPNLIERILSTKGLRELVFEGEE